MNTSPFDPVVKRTHNRLQAAVLIAARYPKDVEKEQDRHLEQDMEYANALDATLDDDVDLFEEEGFFVDDE